MAILLKEISFTQLNKWYVSYYLNPFVIKSKYPLSNLSELIYPSKDRIGKKEYDGKTPVVSKISFNDGKIHLRSESKTGMDLYRLKPNQLLVSKINFHQGAVAINKNGDLVCSTHYQPYDIKKGFVNGDFLIGALRSNAFINFIDNLKAEGIKNEATYEFIGALKIPLPSIEEQNDIVRKYFFKLNKADALKYEAEQKENGVDQFIYNALGIKVDKAVAKEKGLQTVQFKDSIRWAVDYLIGLNSISGLKEGKYQTVPVRQFIRSFQYGISVKATKESVGIPMLRMNNILKGELVTNNLKYTKLKDTNKKNLLLNKGDLLFNRTNSKELVGKTAVFEEEGEFTFASYIIRLKLEPSKVDVHYINYLFNSQIGRTQIDMISRQILGQANINSQELQDFVFPIPPKNIQTEIASKIRKMKEEIASLKKEAEEIRKEAKEEFEKKIFNS